MQSELAEQAGFLWTWWRGDPLPALPPLLDITIKSTSDPQILSLLPDVTFKDIQNWQQQDHQLYVAYRHGTIAAYGVSARNHAAFGAPRVSFWVPSTNRYLYCFFTLPEQRGLGLYPHLLQYILQHESVAERFWIIHQLTNVASMRGIAKAGFTIASKIYFSSSGNLVLVATDQAERVHAGSQLLGLPLAQQDTL